MSARIQEMKGDSGGLSNASSLVSTSTGPMGRSLGKQNPPYLRNGFESHLRSTQLMDYPMEEIKELPPTPTLQMDRPPMCM